MNLQNNKRVVMVIVLAVIFLVAPFTVSTVTGQEVDLIGLIRDLFTRVDEQEQELEALRGKIEELEDKLAEEKENTATEPTETNEKDVSEPVTSPPEVTEDPAQPEPAPTPPPAQPAPTQEFTPPKPQAPELEKLAKINYILSPQGNYRQRFEYTFSGSLVTVEYYEIHQNEDGAFERTLIAKETQDLAKLWSNDYYADGGDGGWITLPLFKKLPVNPVSNVKREGDTLYLDLLFWYWEDSPAYEMPDFINDTEETKWPERQIITL